MTQTIQQPSTAISVDEEVLKVFANMPDALKIEVLHYAEYLLGKNVERQDSNILIDTEINSTERKSLAGFMKGTFVLPLPDDFDEPLSFSEAVANTEPPRKKYREAGTMKGMIIMADDFDEPLPELQEYMD